MHTLKLTDSERKFLLDILTTMQLTGDPKQLHQLLAMVDSIQNKLSPLPEHRP